MAMNNTTPNDDDFAEKYTTICNLVEAMWLKRTDNDYYNIDLQNLPAMTSPEARRIANFIFEALGVDK